MQAGRHITAAALAAAGLALTAGPALAKGGGSGGSGGGQTAPAPAPTPAPAPEQLCPEYADAGYVYTPDGSTESANEIPGVLCVITNYSLGNVLTLKAVRTGSGWVASVKSAGGGSQNKVDVEVTNSRTGEKHSILLQPGKSVVR